jgi:hypothetical protein
MYDMTNFALSEAMMKSQASAMENPAPAANPSTLAMTGFGHSRMAAVQRFSRSMLSA